jgi:hypothetical protein
MNVVCENCGVSLDVQRQPVRQTSRIETATRPATHTVTVDGWLVHHCDIAIAAPSDE